MNAMDMRVLGASALTAAIVSVSIGVIMSRRECPPAVVAVPAIAAAPAPLPAAPPAPAPPTPAQVLEAAENCDAEALKERGMEHINSGQHALALLNFEGSLRCNDDPYVRQLAFMESCASGNSKKAKVYYALLTPAQQTKFAQICIRQNPPVAYE